MLPNVIITNSLVQGYKSFTRIYCKKNVLAPHPGNSD